MSEVIESSGYGLEWWHGRFEGCVRHWLQQRGMQRGVSQRVQCIMRLLRAAMDHICTCHVKSDTQTARGRTAEIAVTIQREFYETYYDARIEIYVSGYGTFRCLVKRAFPSTLR